MGRLCFRVLLAYFQKRGENVKFCSSFGMQFAGNLQADWREGYCFIVTMPGENSSTAVGTAYSPDLAPSDFHLFGPLADVSLMTNRLKRRCGSG
jgi:hypothetical protein